MTTHQMHVHRKEIEYRPHLCLSCSYTHMCDQNKNRSGQYSIFFLIFFLCL